MFCTDNVILHIVDKVFEAKILLDNWCYNLNIGEQISSIHWVAIIILCDHVALKYPVNSSKGTTIMCVHTNDCAYVCVFVWACVHMLVHAGVTTSR